MREPSASPPRSNNASRIGVLLVEQHVHLALAVAHRAYVLSHGSLALAGDAADLRDNVELLHDSYLGAVASTESN